MNMANLEGKTALVTGGTTGIGFATAKILREHGARVAITGVDEKRLADAKAALGNDVVAICADVRDAADLARARADVMREFGVLNILFANAGVAFATPIDATEEARYDEIMDINVKGVFLTVQHFLPLMTQGGSIILNTSWLNEVGTAGLSVLSASKAAVRSFARTLSAELLPKGIRVNAVSPGAINTPIHAKTGMTPEALEAFAAAIQKRIPLGRFGSAEDIAAAVLFLAGDASAYMLGAEIVVDGGFSQL
jgi:NAD(P)-dependent dehydrogenase (short-subunit alcohol dehydrogenase family)